MLLLAQDPHKSVTPPHDQDPELQDNMGKRPPSRPAQDPHRVTPPAQVPHNPELQDIMRKRLSSPPAQDPHSHPSIEQPELLPNSNRETPQPIPSTQQSVYVAAKDSLSSGFYVFRQKVQNINKKACKQIFHAPEPFNKDIVVDEPNKDSATAVKNFFGCLQKYQYKESLKDLGIPSRTVEEFWEDGNNDYNEFEYGKPLVTKQAHTKLSWTMRRLHD
jgi:hypothetical protein